MTEIRCRVDPQRPCLACGAPWRAEEQAQRFDRACLPVRWMQVVGECSEQCWLADIEQDNAAVDARPAPGW